MPIPLHLPRSTMLVVMLTIPDPTYGSFRQEGGEIRVMKVVFVFFLPDANKNQACTWLCFAKRYLGSRTVR